MKILVIGLITRITVQTTKICRIKGCPRLLKILAIGVITRITVQTTRIYRIKG